MFKHKSKNCRSGQYDMMQWSQIYGSQKSYISWKSPLKLFTKSHT